MVGGIELFKGIGVSAASGIVCTTCRISVTGGNVHFSADAGLHRDREGETHVERASISVDA